MKKLNDPEIQKSKNKRETFLQFSIQNIYL